MLDPACAYDTFGDAVKVGRACDAAGFYWLEDPFEDGGTSHHGHRKLRELIKTPLLQGEHVRGLEDRVNFLLADATDFIRGDVPLDGITGSMKLAAAAESLGSTWSSTAPARRPASVWPRSATRTTSSGV